MYPVSLTVFPSAKVQGKWCFALSVELPARREPFSEQFTWRVVSSPIKDEALAHYHGERIAAIELNNSFSRHNLPYIAISNTDGVFVAEQTEEF